MTITPSNDRPAVSIGHTGRLIALALVAAVAFSAALAVPAQARKTPLEDIPLMWKPTDEIGELGVVDLTGLSGVEVQVEPFTDTRENPKLIGKNVEDEDKGRVLEVTTRDEVGPWIADRMAWSLQQFGIDTTDKGATAVVKGEVLRFLVTESNTYASDLGVKITLETPAGKTLWTGIANGSATRFGRSYKAENYYEVLSDAVLEATHDLLTNSGFRAALEKSK